MINRSRSEDAKRKLESNRLTRKNPEFRLQGLPLPYNPDLTVAYPFRLGVIYDNTFKPDLIYLASPASVGFQFLVQLRQLTNPIPTLLNFQTDLSHYSTILFPQPLDQYGVWLLQIVQGFLFQAPAVQTIFYPSAYVRKYMAATGAPEAKMQHLGRGVDTKQFQPSYRSKSYRKQIAPNGEIIFACISRLAPEKGFEFLAKAAIRLAATGLPFKLLIVGGNKNPVVEKEVHEYFAPLGDRVVFTGMLRGDALARAYAAADVFLHCSITETFGLVVLESMASGVPVIARDEGGPSETVKHGDTGFLIPPHDMEKFVAYAHMLATDESMRSEMGVKARAQALDTTWDKINNRVAIQLAAALNAVPVKDDEAKRKEGYYGAWADMAKVYLAVGIVWVFWFIAVVPLMLLGVLHGIVRKR
jgi:glycosyltransferase involved in cell wall biosynthesis